MFTAVQTSSARKQEEDIMILNSFWSLLRTRPGCCGYNKCSSHLSPLQLLRAESKIRAEKSCLVCTRNIISATSSTTTTATSRKFAALHVYHSFKKCVEQVTVGEQRDVVHVTNSTNNESRLLGTVYCCGPTVYDHCHVGHGFTYVRFELLRRVLAIYCNLDLIVGMGITDIDDKILKKAQSEKPNDRDHYISIGQRYMQSFKDDLSALKVSSPHFYLPVTKHIDDIKKFINSLEANDYAYINEVTGDVTFNSARVPYSATINDSITDKSVGKRSPRDFVLWKSAKPGEPFWEYQSSSGSIINGRPGTDMHAANIFVTNNSQSSNYQV